jgi:hypothetical protein
MAQVDAAGAHDECHAIFRYHMHMHAVEHVRTMMPV